jgi:YHS domain-containing protein
MLTTLLLAAALVAPGGDAKPAAKPATNTLCPVMGGKVTEKSPTFVVKGQAYRLCCGGCDKKLQADPAKYLNPDGTPKNAPKAAAK